MKKRMEIMKKNLGLVVIVAMMVTSVSACGKPKDKKQEESKLTSVVTQEVTPEVTQAEPMPEDQEVTVTQAPDAGGETETTRPEVVFRYGDDEEEGGVIPYNMGGLDFYGPIGGYTDKGGYYKFDRGQYGIYLGIGLQNETSLAKEEYFNSLQSMFGNFISDQIGLAGVMEWEWIDQQVYEEVTVNGLKCLKFSGVVGGPSTYSLDEDNPDIYHRFVTGYITESERTSEKYPTTYQLVYVIASYDTKDYDGSGITDEIKEDLQYNVDTLMSTAYWDLK